MCDARFQLICFGIQNIQFVVKLDQASLEIEVFALSPFWDANLTPRIQAPTLCLDLLARSMGDCFVAGLLRH